MLFHFMFNFFSVLFQTEQFTKCIITVILLILSIVIIVRNKEFFLDKEVSPIINGKETSPSFSSDMG
jgi:hypothetical protein